MATTAIPTTEELKLLIDRLATNPHVVSVYATEADPITRVTVFLDTRDREAEYQVYDAELEAFLAYEGWRMELLVVHDVDVESDRVERFVPQGSVEVFARRAA